jgi:hypothetical protein
MKIPTEHLAVLGQSSILKDLESEDSTIKNPNDEKLDWLENAIFKFESIPIENTG